MKKVELLAPAGNLEKLKAAITYGADAVYMGGTSFGLRASAGNFTQEEMIEAIAFAHERAAKVYITVNIIAHNEDLNSLPEYLLNLQNLGVDALIVADPGILRIIKETVPNMEIHLSTQASNTNWSSAKFWASQGINRIILARELTLIEVSEMIKKVPEAGFEVFIHGAMCMSYSGRCLLSNYLTGRDANRGKCAQVCRWKFNLVEENRPNQYFPVVEDERGTYIFNSKDMCAIDLLPELINIGVDSLKIEGRMKSIHYVATITKAYRQAIDNYYKDPNNFVIDEQIRSELNKPSHRPYFTGYYNEAPNADSQSQHYESSGYIRNYEFLGKVLGYDKDKKMALIEQRNSFAVGDTAEIMNPKSNNVNISINSIIDDETGVSLERAPHARQKVWIPIEQPVESWGIMRREIK
ncbi:U32 family peptidase [Clostridium sp. 'deep sea']|uniref:peptidase U32 family protein n=1 Tax=Clostridium sp. 'deep sea' TaxID=2779445 RepID=UPI0018966FB1|nr:U32 family peptidase [Clostridium sp. 'deep sea']QOR35706.1 U32 family peptidase [Clostridium sp. 'deep sea']